MQRDIDRRIKPLIQRYAQQIDAQTAIDATISEKEVEQYIREILSDLHRNDYFHTFKYLQKTSRTSNIFKWLYSISLN